MAVLTLLAHTSRAVSFYEKLSIYIALANNPNWGAADTPPVPTPTDDLVGFLVCKKIESKFLVVPDDTDGTLVYGGRRWRIVPVDKAYEEGARWVFLRTTLNYDEALDVTSYNQLGTYTGLIPKEEVPSGQYVLHEDEIEYRGILEVLDNRRTTPRDEAKTDTFTLVIEF